MTAQTAGETSRPPDLRAVMLALMGWAGALGAFLLPAWAVVGVLVGAGLILAAGAALGRRSLVRLAWLMAAAAVAVSSLLRMEAVGQSPLRQLAEQRAFVSVTMDVASDPMLREGRFGAFVVLRGRTLAFTGRGRTTMARLPVLVVADEEWRAVPLGARVVVEGRATVPDGPDLAAVISVSRPPRTLAEPPAPFDAAAAVRGGIRRAVSGAGPGERTLVPALVVGDDQGMPAALVTDFGAAGLTHLLAVSGTNLTLVVGFLLIVARWAGVRARGLVVVGVLGVAGFVLLARTEPSVVRAAAMGSVALIGMGSNGREKGVRALGVAVLVLLLLDPWLSLSVGFALSALATAGILFLAPPWRDALSMWLPRWLAEAVSVPMAAQLVCTPLVAAISGQVSLVAVAANLLVAPAVGPATVLGLAGGVLVLALEPLGVVLGRAAAACAWWITFVADRSAGLPTSAVDWSATGWAVTALTALCVGAALLLPSVLRRPWLSGLLLVGSGAVVALPAPTPGWPPPGWVMVACDVGQGDGLVLNAGAGRAVVVDVGPEPDLIERCLDRLDVRAVEAVVLTHFHDDHVAALPGLVGGRTPGEIVVTPLAEPLWGVQAVLALAERHDIPVRVPVYGEVRRYGPVTWQVLGPEHRFAVGEVPTEGSIANNASVALLVETAGIRLLLTGDMEPEAQAAMHRALPGLRVDVLKVPHHGSRHQDHRFLASLQPRLAIVSVGEANTYGHPAPQTVASLEGSGAVVRRTDLDGDIAVVVVDDAVLVRDRGG